ncbi:hypothetical protein HK102_003398, partial [Quaeritorhiza haematococci]
MTDSLFSVLDEAIGFLSEDVAAASSAMVCGVVDPPKRKEHHGVSSPRWRPTAIIPEAKYREQPHHQILPTPPDISYAFPPSSVLAAVAAAPHTSPSFTQRAKIIEELRQCLQALDSSTKFLLSLVDDILNFGRLESGVMQLEIQPARLVDELERSLFLLLGESAKTLRIDLECVVEEGVPRVVMTDLLRMKQIINNLVSNALKFTPAGGNVSLKISARPVEKSTTTAFAPPSLKSTEQMKDADSNANDHIACISSQDNAERSLRDRSSSHASGCPPPSSVDTEHTYMESEPIPLQSIRIDSSPMNTTTTQIPSSSSDNRDPTTTCCTSTPAAFHPSPPAVELLIAITDSGIGIPSTTLPDLFKPYTQASVSTARKFGGSGLGLCITSMLVERMEGRIWAESEEGKGSRFMVAVPVTVVEDSQLEQPDVSAGCSSNSDEQIIPSVPTLPEFRVDNEAPSISPAVARVGFNDRHDEQTHQQPPPAPSTPSSSQKETNAKGKGPPDSKTAEEGVSVLVVEDEPINRKIMVRMLRKLLGPTATIHEAADGTEAVDLCAKLVSSDNNASDPGRIDAASREKWQDTSLNISSAAESPAAATTTKLGAVVAKAGSESTINPPSSVEVQGHSCLDMNSNTLPTPPPSPGSSPPPASSPTIPQRQDTSLTTFDPNNTSPSTTRPQPLSVIFMDIIMPIMDGYTASRHIRELGISTPIVVTTANIADAERGRELGVVEAIQKPFTREKIAGVLQK